MPDPTKYVGVLTKNEGQNTAMAFPEGHFVLVNSAGQMAILTPGSEKAMAIESATALPSLDAAIVWIKNPPSA